MVGLRDLPADTRKAVRARLIALIRDGHPCYEIANTLAKEFEISISPNGVYQAAWKAGYRATGRRGPTKHTLKSGEILETPSEEAIPQIVALERQRQTLQANYTILGRKYKELLETTNLTEAIRETVREHVEALPQVPAPKVWTPLGERHLTHETWCIMFSDLHWGEHVRSEEVMGFNAYDKDVATRRVELYVEVQADLILNHLKGYCFDEGFMFALGDNVSGDIHDELKETNIGSTFDGIFEVALIYVQMIRELLTFLPKLTIRMTDDNHGRWTKKKQAKRRYVNHSIEIGHILSALFRDEPRVEFRIDESAFVLDVVRGHRILSMHGDTFRAWNQIPEYGIERGDMRLSQLLASRDLAYEYFLISHFHTSATRDRVVGQRIMNGCIMGIDEYSLTAMHTGGRPKQTVFGMHDKRKTLQYDIDLDTGADEKPRRWTYDFRPLLGPACDRAAETTFDWTRQNAPDEDDS